MLENMKNGTDVHVTWSWRGHSSEEVNEMLEESQSSPFSKSLSEPVEEERLAEYIEARKENKKGKLRRQVSPK